MFGPPCSVIVCVWLPYLMAMVDNDGRLAFQNSKKYFYYCRHCYYTPKERKFWSLMCLTRVALNRTRAPSKLKCSLRKVNGKPKSVHFDPSHLPVEGSARAVQYHRSVVSNHLKIWTNQRGRTHFSTWTWAPPPRMMGGRTNQHAHIIFLYLLRSSSHGADCQFFSHCRLSS